MKNYVYIYHSDSETPPSKESLDAWMEWFNTLGDKVVDGGNPITREKAVLQGGKSAPEKNDVVGYSVVKANNLDEAIQMAMSCPLSNAPGCAVRVYETGEM